MAHRYWGWRSQARSHVTLVGLPLCGATFACEAPAPCWISESCAFEQDASIGGRDAAAIASATSATSLGSRDGGSTGVPATSSERPSPGDDAGSGSTSPQDADLTPRPSNDAGPSVTPSVTGSSAPDAQAAPSSSPDSSVLCAAGNYWNTASASCLPFTECQAGEYILEQGTATQDRFCAACNSGTYSTTPDAPTCQPCNPCGWLGVETTCNARTDTVCRSSDATRQFGTLAGDNAKALAVDADGTLWVLGETYGDADTGAAMQSKDVILYRYTPDGMADGSWRTSSPSADFATGIAALPSGGVWLSGYTSGIVGNASIGGTDAFVQQRDAEGAVLTTQQFGSAGSDFAMKLLLDSTDNVWVGGGIQVNGDQNALLQRRTSEGTLLIDTSFGTSASDMVYGLALDSAENCWIAGTTWGDLAGDSVGLADAFVRLYPASDRSTPVTHQFGTTSNESVAGIAVDTTDHAWVAGVTSGVLGDQAFGSDDIFLRRYNKAGDPALTIQLGTSGVENVYSVVADQAGNIWIAGKTTGNLFAENAGYYDAFVAALNAEGAVVAGYQFGTDKDDSAQAIALDSFGNLWVAGDTSGSLKGGNLGDWDIFVRQIARTP